MLRPREQTPAQAGTTGMSDARGNAADALRIMEKVAHFVADGGYDVQLAGRELATGMLVSGPSPKHLSDVIVQDLPSVKVVSRDRSHVVQRRPSLKIAVCAILGFEGPSPCWADGALCFGMRSVLDWD